MKLSRLPVSVSLVPLESTRERFFVPEVPDAYRANTKSLDHPVVLGVPVTVLICPQSMCNTLEGVYDWACKVICRIDLPLISEDN